MSDDRTTEQKAADDAVLDAIQNLLNLRDPIEGSVEQGPVVVTEYIIVAAASSFALMENETTQYAYLTKDSGNGPHSSPVHSMEGLLRMGLRWVNNICDD